MLKWFLKVCAHVGNNNINTRKFLNRRAIHACMHHAGKKIKNNQETFASSVARSTNSLMQKSGWDVTVAGDGGIINALV